MMKLNVYPKTAIIFLSSILIQGNPVEAQARVPHQVQKSGFWHEVELGHTYTKNNRIDDAICCYDKAAKLAKSGMDFIWLIEAWEDILERRPLDPAIHLALADAFVREQNPSLWNAEVHCKRASYLSPEHRNAQAENLLVEIHKRQEATSSLSQPLSELQRTNDEFKGGLMQDWKPPAIPGFILARFRVCVNNHLRIREIRCLCSSGDKQFDRSALQTLRHAPYLKLKELEGLGMFDFAFMMDGDQRKIDYLHYGSVIVR